MAKIAALIPELEDVKHHSREKRAETLRRLTKLFVEGSSRFNEIHVSLFDDVLGRLAADVEPEARCELSSRLASISNAPIELARRLAHDEIAVAEPLLRNSPRLDESDLISIAQTKGQAHLLAIAGRACLRESVTDVLVERGDAAVVKTLAGNRSARLSARGFAMLARRADPDGVLAQNIGQRSDLPPDLFSPPAAEEIGSKLHCPVHEQDASTVPGSEAEIRSLAKAGRRDEIVAALSRLCCVPAAIVERLIGGERTDPVLILCKAAGLGWPSVKTILALRPKGTGGQSLDAACANFERLAPATVRRVLRFWQARHDTPAPS